MTSAIAAAKGGDDQAFEELMKPLWPVAHRLAYAMLQNRSDAEDAVQSATFKAWRAIGRFREELELRPWFLTIVANECRKQRRGGWWSVITGHPLPEIVAQDPEERVEVADLRGALRRLRMNVRLVLVLRYYLDMSFEEMGRVLGVSAAAAKLRTYRALAQLRVEVPEVLGDE